MNVLSLFNGMGCIWLALDKLGIPVEKRYSSEIDKYATIVNDANYPDTIQLGDIRNVHAKDLEKIDLIVGGSPCQGFSFAGKGLNFDDPRSALFFEFVRLLKECREINPDVLFLLENVKMKHEHEIVISKYLNVAPITINSALVSAQNRVRLYWTNIYNKPYGMFGDMYCDIPQPADKGILLKDILQPENEVDEKYYLSDSTIEKMNIWEQRQKENGNGFKIEYRNENEKSSTPQTSVEKSASTVLKLDKQLNEKQNQEKASCITGGGHSGGNHSDMDLICVAMRGRGENNEQQLEENKTGKTNSLTSVQKDNLVMQVNPSLESGGKQPYQQNMVYDVNGISPALCRDKSDLLITHNMQPRNGKGKGGKGHLQKQDNKSYCCDTTNSTAIEYKSRIRRLTPIEAERLQCVPDNYTAFVSDSQRYRMLGNGWTIDVIVWILSFMEK